MEETLIITTGKNTLTRMSTGQPGKLMDQRMKDKWKTRRDVIDTKKGRFRENDTDEEATDNETDYETGVISETRYEVQHQTNEEVMIEDSCSRSI